MCLYEFGGNAIGHWLNYLPSIASDFQLRSTAKRLALGFVFAFASLFIGALSYEHFFSSVPITVQHTSSASSVAVKSIKFQSRLTPDSRAPPTPLELQLSGVVSAADSRASVALVSFRNTAPAVYRVGDSIDAFTVVIAISDDSMTYRRDGHDFRIHVQFEGDKSAFVPPSAIAQTSGGSGAHSSTESVKYPGFIPGLPATRQADGTELPTGNAQFKSDLEKRFASRQ